MPQRSHANSSAWLAAFVLLCGACALAQPVDHRVRMGGGAGSFADIQAAMLSASPGDRILVEPGTYPWFQFSVGVEVIGLGTAPSDVVVERVAFHPSIPATGFRAVLSNVLVRSQRPLDVLAIAGNEIPPGTLTIDGCILENGVSLRGGQSGFYVLINNCKIIPPPGHGFFDEAVRLGGPGNWVDLRNTRILGWDADPSVGLFAAHALRILGGSRVRIDSCDIVAGQGQGLFAGGTGILGTGSGTSTMALTGNSRVAGGSASGAAGGDGIRFAGTLGLGQATITRGIGNPPGEEIREALVVPIEFGGRVAIEPALRYADTAVAYEPGQNLQIALDATPQQLAWIGVSLAPVLPSTPDFFALDGTLMTVIPVSSLSFQVPFVPGAVGPGPLFLVQGIALDPLSGRYRLSNTAALRIAF